MTFSTDQNYVVSGNLISAIKDDASPVSFTDIIHSNLLAQMTTDKTLGSRFTDPAAWLKLYKKTVGILFWAIIEQRDDICRLPSGRLHITMPEILSLSFFKLLTKAQINRSTHSIDLFNQLPEDDLAFILYNAKTHIEVPPSDKTSKPPQKAIYKVNLQLSIVHTDSEVSQCNIHFQTHQELSDEPFKQAFTINDLIGNIHMFYLKTQILEANYALIRQQVIDKLGEKNIHANILLVPEKPKPPAPPSVTAARRFIRSLEI